MPSCTLRRQNVALEAELREIMQLKCAEMPVTSTDPPRKMTSNCDGRLALVEPSPAPGLSSFEIIISTHPPILESLLSHLPTAALLRIYHTSRHLRSFLQSYPTAWNHLSFRLIQPYGVQIPQSPGNESRDGRERQSKPYALDQLLISLVAPFGTRLRTLDLDNTAVSGFSLMNCVLSPRAGSLVHLSVRGCKNVSLKYHILPFLQLQKTMSSVGASRAKRRVEASTERIPGLALKSLYTYRCRHHRRRPYFASILKKRDSDPEPTHELVDLCHELEIWTDTAWCPTPNGRCLRRKDYHSSHLIQGPFPPGGKEIWVVFDRLWRSSNRIGNSLEDENSQSPRTAEGRLWEELEYGHDGEALGTGFGSCQGEGKHVPAHLRSSHKIFVEDIKCDACGDQISERCEQCSVRMHCMGCRKTFCASCAFDRPLLDKAPRGLCQPHTILVDGQSVVVTNFSLPNPAGLPDATTLWQTTSFWEAWQGSKASQAQPQRPVDDRFWWAPGAKRSPNLLQESLHNDDTDSENEGGNVPFLSPSHLRTPNIKLRWCCLEPMFSGGGGIAFIGLGMSGHGVDHIRTAPLPKNKGWEEARLFAPEDSSERCRGSEQPIRPIDPDYPDPMNYLVESSVDAKTSTSPRTLCPDCHATENWRVKCKACSRLLCKEHDLRGLKMRICGYADMNTEKINLQHRCKDVEDAGEEEEGALESAGMVPLPGGDDFDLCFGDLHSLFEKPWGVPPSSMPLPPYTIKDEAYEDLQAIQSKESSMWRGCGAYFCPWPRPQGDLRPRCPAQIRRCTLCGVHQCESCTISFPPCDCSFCKASMSCPNCYIRHRAGDCRKTIEEEEQRIRERREMEEQDFQLKQKQQADDMAEKLGEFLVGLVTLDDEADDFYADTSVLHTNPLGVI